MHAEEGCPPQTIAMKDMPEQLSVTEMHILELESVYKQTCCSGYVAFSDCDSLAVLSQQHEGVRCALKDQRRTARLWITYIDLIDVLRQFIIGERTGNWLLHLESLQSMLPLSSVTGHANYTRSAGIYLQQMQNLPQTHPWLYDQFMRGHHVTRRSDRFLAGLSPDLCIEQTLMRSGKRQGGLTHGRGMTKTVRTTWLSTLTECSTVHDAMVNLTEVGKHTVEHVEVTDACIKRDRQDVDKILEYFHTYSPFRFSDSLRLISLATGVATSATDSVNCDMAVNLGYVAQQRWDGKCFGDAKVSKSEKTKTLSAVTNKSADSNVGTSIDPHSLFHRLILVAEREQSIKSCFAYELTPYPMALFKDSVMRKPDKPCLYRDYAKDLCDETLPSTVQYVIDGEYLLHKVRSNPPADMRTILSLFDGYVHRFSNDVVVVFDGYGSGPSVKDQEHLRCSTSCGSVAPSRNLAEDTTRIGPDEPFLANMKNKIAFIQILKQFLESTGLCVIQAEGDADTEIVSVAMQFAITAARLVALVLLMFHRQSAMSEVFFCSEMGQSRGRKTCSSKCIRISSVQNKIGTKACEQMLAVHAFGGCDSTSAIFGHGKGSIFKLMDKNSALHDHCLTLQSSSASVDNVKAAGIKLFAAVYGGKADESLAELRYSSYCSMTLCTRFRPESLPPSDSAAAMHALRVHYQCVFWATLGRTTLSPTDWGWKIQADVMTPVHLEGEVAPY